MNSFVWAIVGPGSIAHRFAEVVHRLDNAHIAVVQGRNLERAQAFAEHWQRDAAPTIRATDSLKSLLGDETVRGIYIATPHAFHVQAIRACLHAGKAVLCEKPLVTNAALARELCALAKTKNTFLMEAVWTRFLPIYSTVREWLQNGSIGTIRMMQSSFGFNAPFNASSRLYDPAQAGGALLDIGIYNLTVTRWVMQNACGAFGACPAPDVMQLRAKLAPTGVDQRLYATLYFANDVTSQFVCGVDLQAENAFHIYGDTGRIMIHAPFWGATTATRAHHGGEPVSVTAPHPINGFEGEIQEAMRCINAGLIESPVVPHRETIDTLTWMDQIRREIGVVYPFDENA